MGHGKRCRVTLAERFASKYEIDPATGCWLWIGYIMPNGYGLISVGGRAGGMQLAHRVSYELHVGSIPEGMTLDHVKERGCLFRHCVNWQHLEPVTRGENVMRGSGFAPKNAAKTHCPKGHPYSGDNLYFDDGYRKCRICSRERCRSYRKKETR